MGDPGCRVNGPYGLACREDEKSGAAWPTAGVREEATEKAGETGLTQGHTATYLLLGRVKQPRGLGSQHLATVRVMGLKARGTPR